MFLAGKVEETPRPLKDVILISYEMIHKKDPAAAQRIKQKVFYYCWCFHQLISIHLTSQFLDLSVILLLLVLSPTFLSCFSLSNYCLKLSFFFNSICFQE